MSIFKFDPKPLSFLRMSKVYNVALTPWIPQRKNEFLIVEKRVESLNGEEKKGLKMPHRSDHSKSSQHSKYPEHNDTCTERY
jgi:hypothetical protein